MIFNWIRLRAKWFWCHCGFGSSLIEFCHDCGAKQPIIWWAGASLWYDIVDDEAKVLCPICFDKRAVAKGYFIQWWPDARKRRTEARQPG
jgi:hypothetical protein